jgi:hypothetical protein
MGSGNVGLCRLASSEPSIDWMSIYYHSVRGLYEFLCQGLVVAEFAGVGIYNYGTVRTPLVWESNPKVETRGILVLRLSLRTL